MTKPKKTVIQIVLLQLLKLLILQYIRYMAMKLSKRYTLSGFLSLSIMTIMLDKYKEQGLYNPENNTIIEVKNHEK